MSLNRVQRGEEQRPLRHKAMEVLVLLARHAGQTVSREQLEQTVWQGNAFVAPKAINTAVWTIRQALGDDPDQPRYVETIAKKGYRLIAPVQGLAPEAEDSIAVAPGLPAARRWTPWVLLGVALVAGALAWLSLRSKPPPLPTARSWQAKALTQETGIEYLGAISPDGRQLAFAWWRGRGGGEVYLRPVADASAPSQRFSAGAGDVQGLAWSADGRALVYTATPHGQGCTLWLQPLQGERRALARCSSLFTPNVAWSPDGQHIVFSAEREGVGGLFRVAPDGSGLRRLTSAPPAAMPDHQPAWSPDGQRLVFAREDPADGTRDLYETTLGGSPQRLTRLHLHYLHGISYLADGQDLVLSTTVQEERTLMRWQRRSEQLQPLGLDGSAPPRTHDGALVYALLRGHVSIATMAWQGKPQRLMQGLASDRSPRLAPNGKQLAFVSRRSGHPEIWLAEPDGSRPRALTNLQGLISEPAWQPNGEHLAFRGHCGPGKAAGPLRGGGVGRNAPRAGGRCRQLRPTHLAPDASRGLGEQRSWRPPAAVALCARWQRRLARAERRAAGACHAMAGRRSLLRLPAAGLAPSAVASAGRAWHRAPPGSGAARGRVSGLATAGPAAGRPDARRARSLAPFEPGRRAPGVAQPA